MPKTGVDYATDNITVYRACVYRCRYCWANLPLFRRRIERGRYNPVAEAKKYVGKSGKIIVVSFTGDPYPPVEEQSGLTRMVLAVLGMGKGNRVLVLTKNPRLALRDLDIMREHGDMWLGTTITCLDDDRASDWEPVAPPPSIRLEALREAHEAGVKTWVSVEPMIPGYTDPAKIIEDTSSYVDWYVLGSFNYMPQLGVKVDADGFKRWIGEVTAKALDTADRLGKKVHVKRELRRLLYD